jgi:hypothetical protein
MSVWNHLLDPLGYTAIQVFMPFSVNNNEWHEMAPLVLLEDSSKERAQLLVGIMVVSGYMVPTH